MIILSTKHQKVTPTSNNNTRAILNISAHSLEERNSSRDKESIERIVMMTKFSASWPKTSIFQLYGKNSARLPTSSRQPWRAPFLSSSFLLFLFVLVSSTTKAAAAAQQDVVVVVAKVTCMTEDGSTRTLRPDQINDNYCDCPYSAEDEPDTAACAGSLYWPGGKYQHYIDDDNKDNDDNNIEEPSPPLFTCPQQPNLKLSLSKVGDGICDCCDGADEAESSSKNNNKASNCPDNCAAILAEERRRLQALQTSFTEGAKLRAQALEEYANFVQESHATLETNQAEADEMEKVHLKENEMALTAAKADWIKTRLDKHEFRVKTLFGQMRTSSSNTDSGAPDLTDFVEALTTQELQNLIVHSCQVAGEMPEASSHKTCVPLRLAGVAAGVGWEPKTYELKRVERNNEESLVAWADLVHGNLENSKSPKWHVALVSENTIETDRRRLDDEDFEEDFYDDHEDYPGYGLDMDDEEDEDDYSYRKARELERNRRRGTSDEEEEGDVDQRKSQTAWVKEQAFSAPRVRFLSRTDTLLTKLDELTREPDEQDEAAAREEKPETAEPEPPAGFDPMEAPLLRKQIERRRKAIEKGFTYAVSAKVLVNDLNERDILQSLLYGVWFYGRLSAWHMWQVYQAVVPELGGTIADAESCQAVWACPASAATRNLKGETFSLPPAFFVQVADEHCKNHKDRDDAAAICGDDDSIPASIWDGLYGYHTVEPRSEEDLANDMLADSELEHDTSEKYAIVKRLLETQKELESKYADIEREITKIKDNLGEDTDGTTKYGPDGELYSVRESCLDITAGKYVYELCMFGSSKQKEGKQSGGTDLGRWTGASVNDEGQRVWAWENGAKCWNGPKRSAWAHVTCGSKTKIISADEPETCKYVFQVESYIACDDAYRVGHNLS